jgi:hypothetical protein
VIVLFVSTCDVYVGAWELKTSTTSTHLHAVKMCCVENENVMFIWKDFVWDDFHFPIGLDNLLEKKCDQDNVLCKLQGI